MPLLARSQLLSLLSGKGGRRNGGLVNGIRIVLQPTGATIVPFFFFFGLCFRWDVPTLWPYILGGKGLMPLILGEGGFRKNIPTIFEDLLAAGIGGGFSPLLTSRSCTELPSFVHANERSPVVVVVGTPSAGLVIGLRRPREEIIIMQESLARRGGGRTSTRVTRVLAHMQTFQRKRSVFRSS